MRELVDKQLSVFRAFFGRVINDAREHRYPVRPNHDGLETDLNGYLMSVFVACNKPPALSHRPRRGRFEEGLTMLLVSLSQSVGHKEFDRLPYEGFFGIPEELFGC